MSCYFSYEFCIQGLILKEDFEVTKESLGPSINVLKSAIEG